MLLLCSKSHWLSTFCLWQAFDSPGIILGTRCNNEALNRVERRTDSCKQAFFSLDWLFSDIKELPQGIVLLTSLVHKKTLVVPESNYWWNDWLPWKVREAIEVNRQPSFFSCLQALKWNTLNVSHSDYIRILQKMPTDVLFFPVVWNWKTIHYALYIMMIVRKRRYSVHYKITITTFNKLLFFTLTQNCQQLGHCHHTFLRVDFPPSNTGIGEKLKLHPNYD